MKLYSSQKGTVFITIAFAMTIVFILTSLMFTLSTNELKISRVNADTNNVHYIALSGIEKGMAYVLSGATAGKTETLTNFFHYQKEHSVKWTVTYDSTSKIYTITSTGNFGKSKKVMTRKVRLGYDYKVTIME